MITKTPHRWLNRFSENNGGNKEYYCYPLNLYPDIIAPINCRHVQFSLNRILKNVQGTLYFQINIIVIIDYKIVIFLQNIVVSFHHSLMFIVSL